MSLERNVVSRLSVDISGLKMNSNWKKSSSKTSQRTRSAQKLDCPFEFDFRSKTFERSRTVICKVWPLEIGAHIMVVGVLRIVEFNFIKLATQRNT